MNWAVFAAVLSEDELDELANVMRSRQNEVARDRVKGYQLNDDELATLRSVGVAATINVVRRRLALPLREAMMLVLRARAEGPTPARATTA